MAALYDYACAILRHWIFLMGSGLWLLDRLGKWFQFDLNAYANRRAPWISNIERRRVVSIISVLGIVTASFLTFNDERNLFIERDRALDIALNKKERLYKPLTAEQESNLTTALQKVIPESSIIQVGTVDNPSLAKLAEKLVRILKKIHIVTTLNPSIAEEIDEHGLYLYIRHPEKMTAETKSYLDAFRDAGLEVQKADLEQLEEFPSNIPFTIYVSYPPS